MKKVLVVDDQYPIRRMVRWSVEHAGFEMHEAPNGEQGLAMALALKPSLLLLDVMMPGRFDGLEVCRQLRGRPRRSRRQLLSPTATRLTRRPLRPPESPPRAR